MRPNIVALAPYSTARDEYQGEIGIYLDANENPFENGCNRYPDPYQRTLKAKLSELKGVAPERIFVGNGSDEAIDLAYRVFCEPGVDNVVSIAPTYGMYKVVAAINNVEFREVPLNGEFMPDPERLLAATDKHTKLMFLCSPNNPSGNSLDTEVIERLLTDFKGIVVLDEAYIDFSSRESFLSQLERFPNLIVIQTLSKAWASAGLRVGTAYGDPFVIETFTRVKYPYNISVVTQRMALEQLERGVADEVRQIVEQRDRLVRELGKYPVIKYIFPSDANFLLVRVDRPRELYNLLIEQGVIVRDRSHIAGCEGCLRITVGTPEENDKLLLILQNIV